jgi:hypothetical protein
LKPALTPRHHQCHTPHRRPRQHRPQPSTNGMKMQAITWLTAPKTGTLPRDRVYNNQVLIG